MNTHVPHRVRLSVAAFVAATSAQSAFAHEPKGVSSVCDLTPPTPSRLGFAALPTPLSPEDRRVVKEAELNFQKGNHAEAKVALDPVVAQNPNDGELRYRLAVASAAAGDVRTACAEISRLMELDLVGFAKRYEDDKAFSVMRSSDAGIRVAEHMRAVEVLWRQAMTTGLPAMMSKGARGGMGIWKPSYLRGGVYLHEVQRFLPLEPGVEGASAALVNPQARTVSVLKFATSACKSDFCPHISAVQVLVFSLDDFRRPPSRWRSGEETTTMIDLRSGPRGTAVRIHDCCCWKGCTSPWTSIGPKRAASGDSQSMEMSVDFRGSLLGIAPPGIRIAKGGLLSVGAAAMPLSAEHEPTAVHDILVDESAGARLVFSATDRCECSAKKEGPIFHYDLSTINAKTGTSTVVEHNIGTGAAMLDGKKAVYVQTGDTVRRWPSIASVGKENGMSIMPGVVLVVPRSPSGNCCGL